MADATKTGALYGLLTEFSEASHLMESVEKCRDHGFTKWDVHTPFPVHGMDDAMGIRGTRLPFLVLGGGLTGLGIATLMQWWMNAIDYPFLISGKPLFGDPGQRAHHVRADGAAQRLRLLLRHVGPERHAAAVPPAVHQRAFPARHPGPLLHRGRGRRSKFSWKRPVSSWPPWVGRSSKKSTKVRRTDRCRVRSSTCFCSWRP